MQFRIKNMSILHVLGCLLTLSIVNTIIKLAHIEQDYHTLIKSLHTEQEFPDNAVSNNKNNKLLSQKYQNIIKNVHYDIGDDIQKEITELNKKLQQQPKQKREERFQQSMKEIGNNQKVEKLQQQRQRRQRPQRPQQQTNKDLASSSIKNQKIAFIHTNNDVSTYDILHTKLPKILKQYNEQQQHTNNNIFIELEEVYYGTQPKNHLLSKYTTIIIPIWNPYTRMLYNLQHYNNNDVLYNSIYNFFNNDVNKMITLGLRNYKFTSNHRMERCQLNTKKWFYDTYYSNTFYPTLSYMQELLMNFKYDEKLLKEYYGNNNIIFIRIDDIHDFYIDLNNTILGSTSSKDEDKITNNDSLPSSNEIKLSKEGQNNICEILCTEIQIYKKIVQSSQPKKLSSQKIKNELFLKLKNDCPVEYFSSVCKEKKRRNKAYYMPVYDSTKNWNDYDNVTIPKNVDIGNQTLVDLSNEKRRIGFIHIGKTGGVTASTMIRKKCFFGKCRKNPNITLPENIPANETQISLQVLEYFHGRKPENPQLYNSYIVTARHPIKRFISFYLHKHPMNGLVNNKDKHGFFKCFPNIDTLANFEVIYQNNEECRIKAFGFFRSSQMHKMYTQDIVDYDNKKNYPTTGKSNESKKKENEIFLLRTEFFWDDWQSINTMLGGGEITKVKSINHYECSTHKPTVTNRTVSTNGMKTLCFYMCRDIQAYAALLRSAVNLNEKEKSISWKMLYDTCPHVINLDQCPSFSSNATSTVTTS